MGVINKDDGWRLPDELWTKIEPLLPEGKAHPLGCHNSRVPNRDAMNAILFVLRTGCQWGALDGTGLCKHSSAHRRFVEWVEAGVFLEFWRKGLLALLTQMQMSLRRRVAIADGPGWSVRAMA